MILFITRVSRQSIKSAGCIVDNGRRVSLEAERVRYNIFHSFEFFSNIRDCSKSPKWKLGRAVEESFFYRRVYVLVFFLTSLPNPPPHSWGWRGGPRETTMGRLNREDKRCFAQISNTQWGLLLSKPFPWGSKIEEWDSTRNEGWSSFFGCP